MNSADNHDMIFWYVYALSIRSLVDIQRIYADENRITWRFSLYITFNYSDTHFIIFIFYSKTLNPTFKYPERRGSILK